MSTDPSERQECVQLFGSAGLPHAVFSSRRREGEAEIFSGVVSPERNWFIGEHHVKGIPTLVGTAHLELVRAAFSQLSPAVAELRDVVFLSPLMMPDDRRSELELTLTPAGGPFEFQIRSRPEGADWLTHAMGRVGPAAGEDQPGFFDMAGLMTAFGVDHNPQELTEPLQTDETHVVQVGPRWRCLMLVAEQENEAFAILRLSPEFAGDLKDFALHPALLDCATSFALTWAAKDGVYLPYGYERIKVNKPMEPELYCYARYTPATGPQDEIITLDVDLFSAQGELLVEVVGYNLKRVHEATLKSWDSISQLS
jgi:hypothetical protein